MDRSDVINLIAVTRTQDDFGVWRESETSRQIFCQVDSITASEFFEGGRNGLNPEFRFRVFNADYEGEPVIEYNKERFSVYRTYLRRDDTLELYVERKGGTNGTNNP